MLLEQNHDNSGLLGTLGTLFLETGKIGLAISFLHRAASMAPAADLWCNLAIAYKQSGQQDKTYKYFKKAMGCNPTPEIIGNYAGLFVNTATPDEAIKHANRAIKMKPDCHMAHWNKALALLEKGEWKEGWEEHEWGLRMGIRGKRQYPDIPTWDGTNGKTIVVCGEQGLGDEIMFASMLPDLMKNNTVIMESSPRLKTLFEKSFDGLLCYGTRLQEKITWPSDHKIDASIAIGSLGKYFRNKKEDFPGTPYLKVDDKDIVPRGTKFRVGISWTGGLKPGRVAARSVPLQLWGPILGQDCEFVSLQYTDCQADLADIKNMGFDVKYDAAVKADDYYETARLVKSCDLVITIATSVYHLAGALGVPCWMMAPNKPAWREQLKGTIPWYRSVRVYRQPEGGNEMWVPVIYKVAGDLDELLKEKLCDSPIQVELIGNTGDTSFSTTSQQK